jgi:manganese/zinc/iron transport system permease protein
MILPYNTVVVLAGVGLLGAAAGLVGTLAMLRRRSLLGDVLGHASLPGICLAFLLLQERNLTAMLIGAALTGIVATACINGLVGWSRMKEDAALGTVLTVFFGLGIVLLRLIQNQPGGAGRAGLDSFLFGKTAGMTAGDVYLIAGVAATCLLLVLLFYKELKLLTFDSDFGRALGWPVSALDMLLMTLLAVAVVVGLPAVGVVLVAALLILPAAAARFWTDRLGALMALATVLGGATGLVGTMLSATWSLLPAGPIMVLTGTTLFLASLFLGSKRGLVAQWWRQARLRRSWRQRQRLVRLWDQYAETRQEPDWSNAERASAFEAARKQRLWEAYLQAEPDVAGQQIDFSLDSPREILGAARIEELKALWQAAGRWPEWPAQWGPAHE